MRTLALLAVFALLTGAAHAQTFGIPSVNYCHVSVAAGPLMPPAPVTAVPCGGPCASPCPPVFIIPTLMPTVWTIETTTPFVYAGFLAQVTTPPMPDCIPGFIPLLGGPFCAPINSIDIAPIGPPGPGISGIVATYAGLSAPGISPAELSVGVAFPTVPWSGVQLTVQGYVIDPTCFEPILMTNAFSVMII